MRGFKAWTGVAKRNENPQRSAYFCIKVTSRHGQNITQLSIIDHAPGVVDGEHEPGI